MLDQILVNTSDSIEIDVYYNNVLTDPESISIKSIRDPNGNVILTNQSVNEGSTTGRYYYELDSQYTDETGVYTAVWQFVISSATYEHIQNFEVVSSLRQGYVTPYEVKQMALYDKLTGDNAPEDDTIQKYIDRATEIMDAYLGDSINYAQYSEVIRCVLDKAHNGVHIQLNHRPIQNVTSCILEASPENTLTLDTDYIRVNEKAGYLEYFRDIDARTLRLCTFDPTKTNIVPEATVVYTAGYITVPEKVKQAAVMTIEELYKQTQGTDKNLVSFKLGNTTEKYQKTEQEKEAIKELGLSNAQAIIKLLRPYCQPFRRGGFAGPLG